MQRGKDGLIRQACLDASFLLWCEEWARHAGINSVCPRSHFTTAQLTCACKPVTNIVSDLTLIIHNDKPTPNSLCGSSQRSQYFLNMFT